MGISPLTSQGRAHWEKEGYSRSSLLLTNYMKFYILIKRYVNGSISGAGAEFDHLSSWILLAIIYYFSLKSTLASGDSFEYSFIHSLSQYLLNSCCVHGTVLSVGGVWIKEWKNKRSFPLQYLSSGREDKGSTHLINPVMCDEYQSYGEGGNSEADTILSSVVICFRKEMAG